MNEGGPCETPLIDLLRSIPEDAVYQWEDEVRGLRSWSSSPIGKHCHRAADEIEQLRKDRDGWHSICDEQGRKISLLINAASAPRDDLARFLIRLDTAVDQALSTKDAEPCSHCADEVVKIHYVPPGLGVYCRECGRRIPVTEKNGD